MSSRAPVSKLEIPADKVEIPVFEKVEGVANGEKGWPKYILFDMPPIRPEEGVRIGIKQTLETDGLFFYLECCRVSQAGFMRPTNAVFCSLIFARYLLSFS